MKATSVAIQDETLGIVRKPTFRWRVAMSVSLLFAMAFFTRHLAGYAVSGSEYTPFVYSSAEIEAQPHTKYDFRPDDTVWDEARAYARMTQGVLRGELLNSTIDTYQPYLAGGKTVARRWFIRDGVGQVTLAGLAWLPPSSVPFAFLVADLIFVFFCSLTMMMLCFAIRPSMSYGLAGAAFVLFFNWRDLLNGLDFFRGAPQNSSMFLRTPYPQVAFPLLILFVLAVISLLEKPSALRVLMAATTLAISSYTYFYSWTFAYAFVAAVGILLFGEEGGWVEFTHVGTKTQRALGGLAIAGALGLLASLPVWAGVLQKTAAVSDSFRRLNGELTHAIDLHDSIPLLIVGVAILVWKKKGLRLHWLTPAIIIASLLTLNVQVLTGKTIQPGHWTTYFIRPLLQLCFLDMLWTLIQDRRKIQVAITYCLAIGGILLVVVQFWTAAVQSAPIQTRSSSFDQLVETMARPELLRFGFVTNDVYLSTILPAFVRQKPLMPSYMDPLSDTELSQLQLAAAEATGYTEWSEYARIAGVTAQPDQTVHRLHFRSEMVMLVVNKHRAFPPSANTAANCRLLDNTDFAVFTPCAAR